MDNESNPNDEEKLKSLLETLRKNDEKVPKELLRTKYKKPYRELKESIKEVADRMLNGRIREGIVIKTDEAGQVLIKQIQTTLDEKRNAGTGKELGRALYKEYKSSCRLWKKSEPQSGICGYLTGRSTAAYMQHRNASRKTDRHRRFTTI